MAHRIESDAPIIVLQSFRPLGPTANPYLAQLMSSMPPSVELETFSWRRALLGKYDVFHCHWPENLIRSASWRLRWLARVLFALFLVRIRLRRTPVVRTAHNLGPHEQGVRVERVLLRYLDRRTSLWITLADQAAPRSGVMTRVIPHGHYRDWYVEHPVPPARPGHLLFFGLIRPYKGVEELLDSFLKCTDRDARLRIVGGRADPGLVERIEAASRSDPRVTAHLSHATDEELAAEIGHASAVVLPYREMHNSGALLLTLSLGRRAFVPASDSNEAISSEVGPGWVATFQPPWDSTALDDAIELSRRHLPQQPPQLDNRDWPQIGELHAAAYRDALALR